MDINKINNRFRLLIESNVGVIKEDKATLDKIKQMLDSKSYGMFTLAVELLTSQNLMGEALETLFNPSSYLVRLNTITNNLSSLFKTTSLDRIGNLIDPIKTYTNQLEYLESDFLEVHQMFTDIEDEISEEVYDTHEDIFHKRNIEFNDISNNFESTIGVLQKLLESSLEVESIYQKITFDIN